LGKGALPFRSRSGQAPPTGAVAKPPWPAVAESKRAVALEPAPVARGLLWVTAAGWLGNVLSYLLLLAAARRLGTADYAELVTLLNLLLIGSVPSFALQAVAARRVATGSSDGLLEAGAAIGLGAALLIMVLSPALVAFLHLPGLTGPLLVALSMPGTALQGLCQGVWQGERRLIGLAVATFAGTAGRSGAGLAGLFLGGTSTTALAALAIGLSVPAAGCVLALPELRRRGRRALLSLAVEAGHASHAYGVFLLLSVSDVLLARHVLSTSAAAVYAAGSVLTKACLWLPQSVASVLFASLTDSERHHRVFARAVAGIAGLGLALVVGSWLLSGLVTNVVGGGRYPQLRGDAWLFAMLGGCLAILQFTLVAGLAVRNMAVTALIWATVAGEAVLVLSLGPQPSVRLVIGLMAALNLLTAAAAVLLRLAPGYRARGAGSQAAAQLDSPPGHSPGT
jgi:O-antigen/teichoic acid export membrane protein